MENNIAGDNMFMTITLVIFFLLFFILFVPSSLNINMYVTCDRFFLDIRKQKGMESKITYKLCGIIPVFYKKLFEKKNKERVRKQSQNKVKKVFNNRVTIFELLDKSYIEKFVLSLGFNLENYIANSYVNATLNSILCLYINFNQEKFNLKKLYYQTYVGENLANLSFQGIIKISLADTIRVVGKEYFKLLKEEKEKSTNDKNSVLMFKKRSEKYGRASD